MRPRSGPVSRAGPLNGRQGAPQAGRRARALRAQPAEAQADLLRPRQRLGRRRGQGGQGVQVLRRKDRDAGAPRLLQPPPRRRPDRAGGVAVGEQRLHLGPVRADGGQLVHRASLSRVAASIAK
jgi:hypothetical protein